MTTDAPGPLVFAHRGSSANLPEHTLGAYEHALAEGVDGLECDVRLTRDGHLVCLHDRRLDRTSTGRGPVSARTLAELDGYDFGSWHPGGRDAPARIPVLTLDLLLRTALDSGRPVRLLVETKHPSRYGADVERRLAALLDRYGLTHPKPDHRVQVSVMSFSPLALRHMHALAPDLPTVLLLEVLLPGLRLRRLPFGTRIAGPAVDLIRARPTVVEALRAGGNGVYVWTVNEPADIDLVLAHRVDGIITDRPGAVLARLGRRPPPPTLR